MRDFGRKLRKSRKTALAAAGLGAILAATALVAGCGDSNGATATDGQQSAAPTQAASSPTAGKDPIKLFMWGGVPPENGPQEVVDNWNKLHPDIQVEYVRFVNDNSGNLKLDTALISSQPVDMYMSYDFSLYEKRVKTGNALDLSKFSDYNVDAKMGESAEFWKVDGKYYGVPTKKGLSFVWLNKDMLDAKGLPVPTDWTFDDMQEYARKLRSDKVYGWSQADYYFQTPIIGSYLKQSPLMEKPDKTSAFDSPFTVKALQVYSDMMFKDKSMMPHTEQLTSKPALDQMFVKGETAMLFSTEQIFRTTNNTKEYPRSFKVAAAPMPRILKEQTDFINIGGLGDVLSINPRTKYPEAAWEFIKWYSDEGMLPLAAGGRVPSSQSFNADAAVKLMFSGVENTYDLESVKRVMFGSFPLGMAKLDKKTLTDHQAVYDKVFTQKLTPEEGAKELARIHNQNIKADSK